MIKKVNRNELRKRKCFRVRKKVFGTIERPRMTIYKSLKHLHVQVINDDTGRTLVSSSTIDRELKDQKLNSNSASAKIIGKNIAEKAIKSGITKVVFDRNGYTYGGVLKELADAARATGLDF